jgi:zinc/manganese transport system permease protein
LVTVIFLILVGATVAEAVQAVGALLILGLMVTPAAIAQRLTSRPYVALLLSGALAVLFVWLGLGLAFYISYPASFFITALAFGTYLVSLLATRLPVLRASF